MCGRVCSLSRVKGGVECCGVCHACPVVRGRGLLVACVGVGGLRFLGVAGGYWRVVGEGVFPPPPFFCCCRCSPGLGKRKVAAWGECLVSSFCVKGVVSGGCEVACEWRG